MNLEMNRLQVTTPEPLPEETGADAALRPSRLDEFVGQEQVKSSLQIAIDAAKQRRETLDHTLFFGPPGLGKTTLAMLMAREMGVQLRTTSGPVLEKPGDLVGLLTSLGPGDMLFIDEIHRLKPVLEEFLYPGGFAAWDREYRPGIRKSITPRFHIIMNGLLLVACYDVATLAKGPLGIPAWLTVTALLFSNAFWHVIGAARTRTKSVTSMMPITSSTSSR